MRRCTGAAYCGIWSDIMKNSAKCCSTQLVRFNEKTPVCDNYCDGL